MGTAFMLLISRQVFEQALQHGQTVEKHGKAFEMMARSLEGQLFPVQMETIEQAGQQIQQHGRRMIALVQLALQDKQYVPETYALVHEHQRQAVLLYIKAIRMLLQATEFAYWNTLSAAFCNEFDASDLN
jgi:hypothetical protein